MTPVDDLAAWLTQIWDEEEPNIRMAIATGEHGVSQFDLDRLAADRQILALHTSFARYRPSCRTCESRESYPCDTARLLAQPYADRPGFRDEWRVTS